MTPFGRVRRVSTTFQVDVTAPSSKIQIGEYTIGVWVANVITDTLGNQHLVLGGVIDDALSGRAGMGIQAATGERALVLVGDGAFEMTGWELGNCRRYGWDPIVIVFNNASWETLRAFVPEASYTDRDGWPFHELAEPLGGVGIHVRTRRELAAALEQAVETRGRFVLIDVELQPGGMSRTLSRYIEAFERKRGQGG